MPERVDTDEGTREDTATARLRAYTIRRNVASIAAIPLSEWCGNPEGDATRAALLALAESGADVYAYTASGHRGQHWNIWFLSERLSVADLVYGPANAWLRRLAPKPGTPTPAQPTHEGGEG